MDASKACSRAKSKATTGPVSSGRRPQKPPTATATGAKRHRLRLRVIAYTDGYTPLRLGAVCVRARARTTDVLREGKRAAWLAQPAGRGPRHGSRPRVLGRGADTTTSGSGGAGDASASRTRHPGGLARRFALGGGQRGPRARTYGGPEAWGLALADWLLLRAVPPARARDPRRLYHIGHHH